MEELWTFSPKFDFLMRLGKSFSSSRVNAGPDHETHYLSLYFSRLRDVERSTEGTPNNILFPKLEVKKITNLGHGCRLRLRLPNRAELGAHYESEEHPGAGGIGLDGLPTDADRWGMSLHCNKSSEDYVASGWAAKKKGKWELNENEANAEIIQLCALRSYEMKAKNSEGWAISDGSSWKLSDNATNNLLLGLNALRFYKIEFVQFNGWAVTYDDTFGDEKFRQRTLSYCLVRLEKAICGESKVGYLESIEKNRRADLTPYVLKILKSMNFLEDIAPADGNGLETQGR